MVLFVVASAFVNDAAAQERRRPRTLMELLFRSDRTEAKKPEATVRAAPKKKKAPVAKAPPEPEALPKSETAKTVLVVGDFMGSGLAEGLATIFAQNPDVRVLDRTQGSSGFVRADVYDWSAQIGGLVSTEKPFAVIVMVGSNDRQQMKVGDNREQAMSAPWIAEYTARVDMFAEKLRDTKIPVLWVGIPAFKSTKMSQDMVALNDIYRKSVETVGGSYIDIWDGFVDESGAFVSTGPDVNGQPVRLRASDGINLSKAGKRKAAFYVEKPLAKLLGTDAVPIVGPIGPMVPGASALPGGIASIDRTPPISFTDPELDGGTELLGLKTDIKKNQDNSVGERLAVEGVAPPARPGRADDFGGIAPAAVASRPVPAEPTDAAEATPVVPDATSAIRR